MNQEFMEMAHKIPGSWKKLAIFLGIDQNKIEEISLNHPFDAAQQALEMLTYWWRNRKEDAQSWREELGKALQDIERDDLAQKFTGDIF